MPNRPTAWKFEDLYGTGLLPLEAEEALVQMDRGQLAASDGESKLNS